MHVRLLQGWPHPATAHATPGHGCDLRPAALPEACAPNLQCAAQTWPEKSSTTQTSTLTAQSLRRSSTPGRSTFCVRLLRQRSTSLPAPTVTRRRGGDKSLMDKFASAKKQVADMQQARRRRTLSLVAKPRSTAAAAPPATQSAEGGAESPAADSKRGTRSVFHKDVKASFRREVGRDAARHEPGAVRPQPKSAEYESTVVAIRSIERKTRTMKLHAVANRCATCTAQLQYLYLPRVTPCCFAGECCPSSSKGPTSRVPSSYALRRSTPVCSGCADGTGL